MFVCSDFELIPLIPLLYFVFSYLYNVVSADCHAAEGLFTLLLCSYTLLQQCLQRLQFDSKTDEKKKTKTEYCVKH